MPFEFEKLGIEGLILVKPKVFGDNRGFFMESYKKSDFVQNGIDLEFIQHNHSKSVKGVLRGLHYQAFPKAQAKLVRCIKGKIHDVAVDLRANSPTFGKWAKVELSEENHYMFFIPEGFAHGFVVLSDEAELIYKTNAEFSPQHDRGVLWCDNDINVDWGIDFEPILSEKDKVQPRLAEINKEELLCDCWSQAAQVS
jgi:dTDP-4-dehydrorhamnose 3,5-epimerase